MVEKKIGARYYIDRVKKKHKKIKIKNNTRTTRGARGAGKGRGRSFFSYDERKKKEVFSHRARPVTVEKELRGEEEE